MTGPVRIKLNIGTLRVQGASLADARIMADALRTSLHAHLAANPGVLSGTERLRLTVPQGAPAVRGAAMGTQIGAALTGPKGGKK